MRFLKGTRVPRNQGVPFFTSGSLTMIGSKLLAAADELDDLQGGSWSDFGSRPVGLADDLPVEFYGYAFGGDFEVLE